MFLPRHIERPVLDQDCGLSEQVLFAFWKPEFALWQISVQAARPDELIQARAGLLSGRLAELAKGHGGTLSLQQTGPEGTVFCLNLPKGDGTL